MSVQAGKRVGLISHSTHYMMICQASLPWLVQNIPN